MALGLYGINQAGICLELLYIKTLFHSYFVLLMSLELVQLLWTSNNTAINRLHLFYLLLILLPIFLLLIFLLSKAINYCRMQLCTKLVYSQTPSSLLLPHHASQTLHGKTYGSAADGARMDTYMGLGSDSPFMAQNHVPVQPGHSWNASFPWDCKGGLCKLIQEKAGGKPRSLIQLCLAPFSEPVLTLKKS